MIRALITLGCMVFCAPALGFWTMAYIFWVDDNDTFTFERLWFFLIPLCGLVVFRLLEEAFSADGENA